MNTKRIAARLSAALLALLMLFSLAGCREEEPQFYSVGIIKSIEKDDFGAVLLIEGKDEPEYVASKVKVTLDAATGSVYDKKGNKITFKSLTEGMTVRVDLTDEGSTENGVLAGYAESISIVPDLYPVDLSQPAKPAKPASSDEAAEGEKKDTPYPLP